jgi:alpha-1,6-mannosyltransferase
MSRAAAGAPRAPLVAGTVGAALVALGGTGVGAVPRDGGAWRVLAGSPTTRGLALALSVAGVLLLVTAWWRLRPALARLPARGMLLVTGCWSLPLLAGPPVFSRDAYAYAGQALLLVRGLDPYAVGPEAVPGPLAGEVDPVWLADPSPYGPAYLAAAAVVVAAGGERVGPTVLGLRLLAVAGLLLLAWALPRLARRSGVPASRALWLGLANPLVLLHLVGGAHNDAMMVGLLVAGLAVAVSTRVPGRLVAAAALVALAALVKVPALAGLAYLPLLVAADWPGRLRAAAAAGATAVVTAGLVVGVTGASWGWVAPLDAGRARLSLFSPVTGVGALLGSGLEAAGVVGDRQPVLDAVLSIGVAGGLLVAAGLLVLAALPAPRLSPLSALGLTLVAVVVLGPVVQPWYLLWGVTVLAAVAGPRLATGLGAACAVLSLAVLPSGRSLVRPPLYGVASLAAAAAGVTVGARTSAGERRSVTERSRRPAGGGEDLRQSPPPHLPEPP